MTGAILHFVESVELQDHYNLIVDSLRAQGRVVYELHPGGSDNIGALGYLNVFQEILDFELHTGIRFSKIILPTGSTGTQVGLLLGKAIAETTHEIIGIAISQRNSVQFDRIKNLLVSCSAMLAIQPDIDSIIVDDRFLGGGYAVSTAESKQALVRFAKEGILLDECYTAKGAAGLLHYAANSKGENVLFLLTGCNNGLYD